MTLRNIASLAWLSAVALAILAVLPFVIPASKASLVSVIMIYAVVGISLVVLTGWIGWQLAGAPVGWIAALLLAANPGTFGLSRYAILDAPFTACLFGGAGLVIVSATRNRPRLENLGYLLLAFATCITLVLVPVLYAIFVLDLRLVRWDKPMQPPHD